MLLWLGVESKKWQLENNFGKEIEYKSKIFKNEYEMKAKTVAINV